MALMCVSEKDFNHEEHEDHEDNILKKSLCSSWLILVWIILFTLPISAQTVTQFQGSRITRINIDFEGGLEATDKSEFFDVIDIRPGEEYSVVKIREAILKLYR